MPSNMEHQGKPDKHDIRFPQKVAIMATPSTACTVAIPENWHANVF